MVKAARYLSLCGLGRKEVNSFSAPNSWRLQLQLGWAELCGEVEVGSCGLGNGEREAS